MRTVILVGVFTASATPQAPRTCPATPKPAVSTLAKSVRLDMQLPLNRLRIVIAPDFQAIANTPGMTVTALHAFLQTSAAIMRGRGNRICGQVRFPRNPTHVLRLLAYHGLRLISGWYSGRLLERSVAEELEAIEPHRAPARRDGMRGSGLCQNQRRHRRRSKPAAIEPTEAT